MLLVNQARAMNERSRELYENAAEQVELQRTSTSDALETLGRTRFELYDGELRRFVGAFEKLKNVETTPLQNDSGLAEQMLPSAELREISFGAIDGLKTAVAAGGAGAVSGMVAFGAAGALATTAGGTAIGTLGGAAATNATLAWFGGGALAAGGYGMAGGMVVLGGIVVAPALLVGGFVFHQHGKKKLEQAKANQAEVRATVAELDAMKTVARGIEQRAKHLNRVLKSLGRQFDPMVDWLEALVERETDYRELAQDTREQLYLATTAAVTVRRALEVALLDGDGSLTEQSRLVLDEAAKLNKQLRQAALPAASLAA